MMTQLGRWMIPGNVCYGVALLGNGVRIVIVAGVYDDIRHADLDVNTALLARIVPDVWGVAQNILLGDLARDTDDGPVESFCDLSGISAGSGLQLVIPLVSGLSEES